LLNLSRDSLCNLSDQQITVGRNEGSRDSILSVHAHCMPKRGTNTVLALSVSRPSHLISEVAVKPGCSGYAVCHFLNTVNYSDYIPVTPESCLKANP